MEYEEYDIFGTDNLIGYLYDKSEDAFEKFVKSRQEGEYLYLIMTVENPSSQSRNKKYELVSQHYKVKKNRNSLILHSENRSYKIFPEIKITYNGKVKPNTRELDFDNFNLIGLYPTNGFGTSVYIIPYILKDNSMSLLIGCERYSELRSLENKNIMIKSDNKDIGCIDFGERNTYNDIYASFIENMTEIRQNHDELNFNPIRIRKEKFNTNRYLRNSINFPIARSKEVDMVKLFEIYSTQNSIDSYRVSR